MARVILRKGAGSSWLEAEAEEMDDDDWASGVVPVWGRLWDCEVESGSARSCWAVLVLGETTGEKEEVDSDVKLLLTSAEPLFQCHNPAVIYVLL